MSVRPGQPHAPVDAGDLSALAAEIKALLDDGRREAAAERFGDIVRRWQGRANRLAYYYLGNAADADDAVQDAFVKVYAHMTTFRPELSFDAWFTRILVNTCLDRLRVRRSTGTWIDLEGAGPLESREPSAERALVAASAWRSVADAVRALPPRQRDAFILCHVNEASPKEAAAALGMNPATFRVHLFRALRKLRGVIGAR